MCLYGALDQDIHLVRVVIILAAYMPRPHPLRRRHRGEADLLTPETSLSMVGFVRQGRPKSDGLAPGMSV